MKQAKLAIIGASELQNPLILKAKEKGCETHVFAWAADDVGEHTADFFHPISITDREAILEECRRIGIDGICTIASDLANVCVGYVSDALGLPGNPPDAIEKSTNKQAMRAAFAAAGDPSPLSMAVHPGDTVDLSGWRFPVIVKPVDRSGSRGITKLEDTSGLDDALQAAFECGFEKTALIEEFAEGAEYSFEFMSWEGEHHFLAATQKFTTGAPHFIERGHCEPAFLDASTLERCIAIVDHALMTLGVRCGADHAELKIAPDGTVNIIEIGSRMGGDCIGSDLVQLTTGVDFVGAVVDAALGNKPDLEPHPTGKYAVVKYVFNEDDAEVLERIRREHPEWIVRESAMEPITGAVSDSSTRFGFVVLAMEDIPDLSYLGFRE